MLQQKWSPRILIFCLFYLVIARILAKLTPHGFNGSPSTKMKSKTNTIQHCHYRSELAMVLLILWKSFPFLTLLSFEKTRCFSVFLHEKLRPMKIRNWLSRYKKLLRQTSFLQKFCLQLPIANKIAFRSYTLKLCTVLYGKTQKNRICTLRLYVRGSRKFCRVYITVKKLKKFLWAKSVVNCC